MSEPFSVIHAPHIEEPVRAFWVRYHHRAYRPDGWPWMVPAADRLLEVLADSASGALAVARYHHGLYGSDFHLESRPVAAYSRAMYTVTFAEPVTEVR